VGHDEGIAETKLYKLERYNYLVYFVVGGLSHGLYFYYLFDLKQNNIPIHLFLKEKISKLIKDPQLRGEIAYQHQPPIFIY
jgi:hypothetical protein